MEDWTGIEVDLTRFIGLCKMLERTPVEGVRFLKDGTAHAQATDRSDDPDGEDYLFLRGWARTDRSVTIPARELLAVYHLLGLRRDSPRTVKGQSLRLSPTAVSVLPLGGVYRRRLLAFSLDEETESRLIRLARFTPEPNLWLIPRPTPRDYIKTGGVSVNLTIGEQVEHHTHRLNRIEGTAEVEGDLRLSSKTARTFFALCEQDADADGSPILGRLHGEVLFLRSSNSLIRIRIQLEK